MIIDGHAHVASTKFTPKAFLAGVADNMAATLQARFPSISGGKILDKLLAEHGDHEADDFVRAMDAGGVDRAVLLLPDFTYALEHSFSIAEMAEAHHRIRLKHPGRFHVFMGVDPRWGADGVALFERCVTDYGFEGLKLYPPCGYSPSDPSLSPFYEVCAARGLPVLLHTGPTSPALSFKHSAPLDVDDAARQFPTVNFILAHAPLNSIDQTVEMCAFRPNVFCDISGFAVTGPKPHWITLLSNLAARQINHKVIFGSDWPVPKNRATLKDMVGAIAGDMVAAGIWSSREAEGVLGANLLRIMKVAAHKQSEKSIEGVLA